VSGRSDLGYDEATGTLTYTAASDGDSMAAVSFDLPIIDDEMIEGPEDYQVVLSTPGSTTGISPSLSASDSVTTTIEDTRGDGGTGEGPAQWSVSGSGSVDEGDSAQYTVSLSGQYQAGEVISVELNLTDSGTSSSDYADLATAISTAIAGNPDVTFDAATGRLSYTAPSDGATMADIVIDLPIIDDSLIEGQRSTRLYRYRQCYQHDQ